jgi:2'-5' RNA ligase
MENIRTFIAVDIPQSVKMELDKLISELRLQAPDIRWVRAANLHITLRFLGEIPRDSIPAVAAEIKKNLKGLAGFEAALADIGGFPNLLRPRVIWVGSDTGTEALQNLAGVVEKSCNDAGFGKADKPFSSHLTIGRVKFPRSFDKLASVIEAASFESAPFRVDEVVIFKSDLLPAGPRYTRLETIPI